MLLLCGAGLLLQTVLTLIGGDTGYRSNSESVLTLDFSVRTGTNSRYPTGEAMTQFYDAVGRDVSALPEVRRVGWASSLPYGTSELGRWAFAIVGDPQVEVRDRPTAEYTTADPGYFRTLDLPIVTGRGFNERDTLRACPCVSSTRHSCAGTSRIAIRSARASHSLRRPPGRHRSVRLSAWRGRPAASPMRPRNCSRSTCRWRSIRPVTSTWWCSHRWARRRR